MYFTKERQETFLTLSDVSQQKVVKIFEIAAMFAENGMRPLDSDEFDYLYDLEYTALCNTAIMYKRRIHIMRHGIQGLEGE